MAKGTGSGSRVSSNGHTRVFGGSCSALLAVCMCTIGLPMLIAGSVLISPEETYVAGICILVSALVFVITGIFVIMIFCCYVQQKPPAGTVRPLSTSSENDLRPSVSVIRVQESQPQPPSLDGFEYLPKPPEYRHSPPPYEDEDEDGHPTTTTLAYDGITSIDATASVLRPPTYTSLHR